MKPIVLLLLLGTLAGCTGSTVHGECIGLGADRDPKLVYKISVRNAIWTAVGFEMVLPLILWATDYAYCPVGKKEP